MVDPTRSGRRKGGAVRTIIAVVTGLGLSAALALGTPVATAEPGDALDLENLPRNADLDWVEPGAFEAEEQWTGPDGPWATLCLRERPQEALGAERLFQGLYLLPSTDSGESSALVMEFGSPEEAEEAYWTLALWMVDCEQALRDKYHRPVGEPETHALPIDGTQAHFTQHRYRYWEAEDFETRVESVGLVRDGDRLALVAMDVPVFDHPDWTHPSDGDAEPLHPMYTTMPKVADRLVS